MKLGFKRGEKGFTLIEIIIVLAVLGVLAAVIIPNVTGFLGQGKDRAYKADQSILQAAVDGWRTDIQNRRGGKWPTSDNLTRGVPTDNNTDGDFDDVGDAKNGIIDVALLYDGGFIKGTDALKSASGNQIGATNSPAGSYVWYVDSNGVVNSYYWNSTNNTWSTGFQDGVYP